VNKLFQVNQFNYISVDSVSGITFETSYAIVITTAGAKHRITHDQARLLISCFEVVKPIVNLPAIEILPNTGN